KNNVLQAGRIAVVKPQMGQKVGQGGMGGPLAVNRQELSKKVIAREMKAINENRSTGARRDNQRQELEVEEKKRLKRGSESITLPDIKAGDFVRGPGELKDGLFVAKELMVGRPQMRVIVGPGGQQKETQPGAMPGPSPQPPK